MPETKKDEKEAEEQREKVLAEGFYATQESDDNSIDVSNDAYIGVNEEYKNAANESDVPMDTPEGDDPETGDTKVAEREKRVKESEANLTNLKVNRAGHTIGKHKAGRGTHVGEDGETVFEDPDSDDAKAAKAEAKAEGKAEADEDKQSRRRGAAAEASSEA